MSHLSQVSSFRYGQVKFLKLAKSADQPNQLISQIRSADQISLSGHENKIQKYISRNIFFEGKYFFIS